jgi:hypothetical protein
MTTTTINFTAGADTNLDAFGAGPDWAYLVGSAGNLTVNATNDNVQVTGFAGSPYRARYIGSATVTGDQDVTATVRVKNFNDAGVLAKCSAVADSCYLARIETSQTNEVRLYRVIAGAETLLGSWDDSLTAGTHTIRLRAVVNGSAVDLSVQSNSNSTHTYSDTDASRLTSGNPGLYGLTDEGYPTLDNWILDDLAAAAAPRSNLMLMGVS